MPKNSKSYIAFSIIPFYLIVKLLAKYPEFIEQYYSNGLYLFFSKIFRFVFGWLPFSFGDFFYALSIIYIVRWLIINRKRIIKDTKNWLIDVFAAIAIIYVAFHLFWGMNYYRLPLHKNLNLEANYTTEQLITITKQLIETCNILHLEIAKNDSLKINFPFSKKEILSQIPEGYHTLQKKYTHFKYQQTSIKNSLFSLPLTYMGFSGYLNPLTNEAQVNNIIPKFKLPTTASHEVAHQLGYAAEYEANFIGFLAAINHKNKFFNYSGYTFGLRHCIVEIYRRDEAVYKELFETINPGIIKNYRDVQDFWTSYKNPLEPLFKFTYSNFLKANNQKGGIDSYSYVVALIVNSYQKETR
ncbi:MAG: DUF3810 domain-containing protein [Oceanihabitans sp.]